MKTPDSVMREKCKRCGKPYPVQGIMVCPCHPMFSPNYEPEPPIEFKTEKDCQRFVEWMMIEDKKYSHSLAEARREWVEEMRGLKNPDNDCRHSPEDSCDSNCTYQNEHKIYNQAIDDGIDLLTGDNPESECKVCHRTSDVVDMSKCPFCEHDQELIREGRAMSDRDTRRGE